MSDNLAARGGKPFVMGREDFLSACTPGGAGDRAILHSLVETAKRPGWIRIVAWLVS